MHELSITRGILAVALDEAAKHHAEKIRSLTVTVGAYSGAVPQCVEEYFRILSRGTIADGAELEFVKETGRIACHACGFTGEVPPFTALCPRCGSDDLTLLSGMGLILTSMEVD